MTLHKCPECEREVTVTLTGKYRNHNDKSGEPCLGGTKHIAVEERQLPPEEPCSTSPTEPSPSSSPGPSVTTSVGEPTGITPSSYAQPDKVSQYTQPDRLNPAVTQAVPMGAMAQQITGMLKEIFREYNNRTGRGQQKKLGPSQIGTPCDRQLAMHLMEFPAVNPGSDGWAAFVGTCIHVGLAEMLTWADHGQGRFIIEVEVALPSKNVPHGTADLIDRVLLMVDDHKAMGQWSLDQLKHRGPSLKYRVQLQTYAFGASIGGERINYIGLVAWPRDKPNLDDMYVWVDKYDPAVGRKALARVDKIAETVEALKGDNPSNIAKGFAIDNSDCKYCPYYMPGVKDLSGGKCNGRQ